MSDQICDYVRQRLNPGDGRMTLRHDLDRLFRDFTCKAVHCTLPLYAVFAGSRGIGKSLVRFVRAPVCSLQFQRDDEHTVLAYISLQAMTGCCRSMPQQ